MTEHHDIIKTAHALCDGAAEVILPYFRSGDAVLATENKADSGYDPVTLADRAAEAVMRRILAERRPQDAILGEEMGQQAGTSGLTWVLDPIDGTRGFLSGTPTWGVLVAVSDSTGPIYGLIDQPYTGERFEGGLGRSALHRAGLQTPLQVRADRPLDQSILFSTMPEIGTDAERRAFEAVSDQVKLTRFGMDCYAYALLAAGQIDLVIEAGLHAYDIQAPIAVIEAAGGIVTDWTGGPAHQGGRVIAAAGPKQHAKALEILTQNV